MRAELVAQYGGPGWALDVNRKYGLFAQITLLGGWEFNSQALRHMAAGLLDAANRMDELPEGI
jgi:hypothetical protein